MADPLARESAFLRANVAELAAKYPGRYLLIKGEEVHGAFETLDEGISVGAALFGSGPCLIRSVLEPEDPAPITIPVLRLGLPLFGSP